MFRTIGGRLSPWESLLPPELLRVPQELTRVDALLERAESWGRDKGAEVVRLGTYAHSAVAVGF